MKNLTRFFFYYTFLAINSLAVVSVFFLERPYNLIYAVVLIPSVLFFWLKVTDPQHATESSWSARLVIAIGVLSSLSILGYYLYDIRSGKISDLEKNLVQERANSGLQVASISAELALLREELRESREQVLAATISAEKTDRTQEIADLLNSLDSTSSAIRKDEQKKQEVVLGSIKLTGTTATNVYEEKNSNSKIVGIAEPEKSYKYFEYSGTWYLIAVSEGRQGFIESDKVKLAN